MARHIKNDVAIPARFVPRFWDDGDGRCGIVKEIRRRYEELKSDTGADSYQKDLLVQRAVFIGLQLETMEVEAANAGKFDAGVYTAMTNALSGLLTKLGLNRQLPKTVDLKTYVGGRR